MEDGFPWPQTPALVPGSSKAYNFSPISGTYWMHSHEGLQEQSLMTAPLIVHSADEMREDRQEIVLMLNDFSFTSPDELLARLTGKTVPAVGAMALLTENVSAPAENQVPAPMPSMAAMGAMPGGATTPDLNDIDYDAFWPMTALWPTRKSCGWRVAGAYGCG